MSRHLLAASLAAALLPIFAAPPAVADTAVAETAPEIGEVRDDLTQAQTLQETLAEAAAVAEERLAEAEAAVEAAKVSRAAADAAYEEAVTRQEAAEERATEANDRLDRVTERLDAALLEYQREDAQLRSEAREAYKRSTGGVAESEAVLDVFLSEDQLDVALNRVELLRKIASRQADAAAELGDLAQRIRVIQRDRAGEAAAAKAAEQDAIEAANLAQAALTKSHALAKREATTLEAAEELVATLANQQEDTASRVEALAAAVKELEEQAAALVVTSTTNAVPSELAVYGNGNIPAGALEPIGVGAHRLWAPAAKAFRAMVEAAAADGVRIGITDSYRSFEAQVDVARRKGLYARGGLAARPGTSNHGWGLAVDLDLDAKALAWMRANADRFGFIEDTPREPWHWGFHARP